MEICGWEWVCKGLTCASNPVELYALSDLTVCELAQVPFHRVLTLLPVSQLGRTFAYTDRRIRTSIFLALLPLIPDINVPAQKWVEPNGTPQKQEFPASGPFLSRLVPTSRTCG
jgi:hypothetical protein